MYEIEENLKQIVEEVEQYMIDNEVTVEIALTAIIYEYLHKYYLALQEDIEDLDKLLKRLEMCNF